MGTDKELLELAAKAAGYKYQIVGSCIWLNDDYNSPDNTRPWNPITKWHEAMNLAIELNIHLGLETDGANAWPAGKLDMFMSELYGDDPHSAIRRAIVRVAARIGETASPPIK